MSPRNVPMPRRRSVVLLLAVAFAAPFATVATAQEPERPEATPDALASDPEGWIDPLAGAGPGLKGWTRVPIPPDGTLAADSPWSLDPRTGLLRCDGDAAGHEWLRWDRELGDLIFHVEWRFEPVAGGDPRYNSGIFVRNSADGTIWHQAQAGGGRGGFLFGDTRIDGTIGRVNLAREVTDGRVRPAGEWNTYEITCRGDTITLRVNGAVTCTWRNCQVPTGFLGVEAEGYRIAFRNLRVKPL